MTWWEKGLAVMIFTYPWAVNGLKLVVVMGFQGARLEDGDKVYVSFSVPTTEEALNHWTGCWGHQPASALDHPTEWSHGDSEEGSPRFPLTTADLATSRN